MHKKLITRLGTLFTGALLGYLWGWIWGWSLFDPNSDRWALGAAVLALAGLIGGLFPLAERYGTHLLAATLGLYLSWLGRTFIFGDVPGGMGLLLMLAGSALGLGVGSRLAPNPAARPVLLGALYIGFFGGFLIEIILLDLILGVVKSHTTLSQGPVVLGCAIIGGALVAWRQNQTSSDDQTTPHEIAG